MRVPGYVAPQQCCSAFSLPVPFPIKMVAQFSLKPLEFGYLEKATPVLIATVSL